MINFMWVALGGAIGAMGRYGMGLWLINLSKLFPFATLIVNITGSFLLALLFAWQIQQEGANQQLWLLFGVGVLGAFTTFSTFSLDVVLMVQQGDWLKAILYALLNTFGCIAAVLLALWLKS
ncbi:fluoride efflux transporter CrcB [Pseudidiomarina andamanensis]|uniref:Fluoride-specific ion channel FluC n=1 Tax=Pseudidiomarina andamanensis TaxID=1940690 RepID=A0AA92ES26_9GAMM|nr:fluoride efflux transporter CrcB [Pseudidiomarina andamanensis]MDS0218361.1 fluoride efflux transporter CrcB [Pseudidiomarina andamanensis]QGT95246.1 fluoride efflux transporter CrcB [Pseudidiomarina andamanensis]